MHVSVWCQLGAQINPAALLPGAQHPSKGIKPAEASLDDAAPDDFLGVKPKSSPAVTSGLKPGAPVHAPRSLYAGDTPAAAAAAAAETKVTPASKPKNPLAASLFGDDDGGDASDLFAKPSV